MIPSGSALGNHDPEPPVGYLRVDGSERRPDRRARQIGPANSNERISVTIVLRRRSDGQPAPGLTEFARRPPLSGERLSAEDFAARFGADPSDLERVVAFLQTHGLTVVDTDPAARTVVASGTVGQLSEAFAVNLHRYEVPTGHASETETYRGRDGYIHVPRELADVVVGVFGLDNRRITKRNVSGATTSAVLTVAEVAAHYDFPSHPASGQTIAVLSEDGYRPADIKQYFTSLGRDAPTIIEVPVGTSNNGTPDRETTQDICIAGTVAQGAEIAVYFTTYDQKGWVDAITRIAHPKPGDPSCSVVSISFYVTNGDDSAELLAEGISLAWLKAVTAAFQDAALQHITVCVASGDGGSDSRVGDRNAHVQYPASDPWVLSCGGTALVRTPNGTFNEYVWNDGFTATGGGVSEFFDLPVYQKNASVPPSVNDEARVGRGVPDVSGNASGASGYAMYADGTEFIGYGTSAVAPLYAALIAILNGVLGSRIGFLTRRCMPQKAAPAGPSKAHLDRPTTASRSPRAIPRRDSGMPARGGERSTETLF